MCMIAENTLKCLANFSLCHSKVVVEGRSMVNIISIASELGYLNIPDNTLIEVDQLKNYPDEKTVLITTGSQGEPLAALSRMANGIHRKVKIQPNDLIVFSSNPIPGNEKAVSKIINDLYRQSADVIFQNIAGGNHQNMLFIHTKFCCNACLRFPMFKLSMYLDYQGRQHTEG